MFESLIRRFFPVRPSELELAIDEKIQALRKEFPNQVMFSKNSSDGNLYIDVAFLQDIESPQDRTIMQKEINQASDGFRITFDYIYFRDMSYCFLDRRSLLEDCNT